MSADKGSSARKADDTGAAGWDAGGYWRANLRAIAILLTIWAVAGIGLGVVLVEPLNRLQIGGYPLGFWFAQQGSIFVFIGLIYAYARWMERIDRRHGRGPRHGVD